jgi:hypothetical protein
MESRRRAAHGRRRCASSIEQVQRLNNVAMAMVQFTPEGWELHWRTEWQYYIAPRDDDGGGDGNQLAR